MDEIEKIIRGVFEEELQMDSSSISSDSLIGKENIDTDDLSYLFIPAVEKRFEIKLTLDQWESVGTFKEIADLVRKTLSD
jgi:hypothetical protein